MDEKDTNIMEAVQRHWEQFRLPPNIRWITEECGISSTSVTAYHIDKLRAMGVLTLGITGSGTRKILRPDEREELSPA